MVLTTEELNNTLHKYKTERFHISNDKIELVELIEQPIIEDFNCSGRPNGIYYSFGNSWLNFITTKKTSTIYKPCCYLYHVKVNTNKILQFPDNTSVINFHEKHDKYYLNNINFNLCGEWTTNPTRVIPYNDIFKNKYKNLYDFYKSKKIIFDNREEYLTEMGKFYIDFIPSGGLIRWDKISHQYNGVEFHNYHKNKKTPKWYNTLDVSSGCVWNPKAIEELTLLANVVEYDEKEKTNIWVLTDKGKQYFTQP
jgi:hypothetical protein